MLSTKLHRVIYYFLNYWISIFWSNRGVLFVVFACVCHRAGVCGCFCECPPGPMCPRGSCGSRVCARACVCVCSVVIIGHAENAFCSWLGYTARREYRHGFEISNFIAVWFLSISSTFLFIHIERLSGRRMFRLINNNKLADWQYHQQ